MATGLLHRNCRSRAGTAAARSRPRRLLARASVALATCGTSTRPAAPLPRASRHACSQCLPSLSITTTAIPLTPHHQYTYPPGHTPLTPLHTKHTIPTPLKPSNNSTPITLLLPLILHIIPSCCCPRCHVLTHRPPVALTRSAHTLPCPNTTSSLTPFHPHTTAALSATASHCTVTA
jgi:hypothetical protein